MFLKLYISCFEGMHAKSFQSCLTLLQPRGLWPTRLLCPWNSSGKSTGVGFQALLQGIFPTQGLIPHAYVSLHWQVGSLSVAPPVDS